MKNINKETLEYLKGLCRLDLTESEENSLIKDLTNILNHMDQLSEVDTTQVEPCYYVLKSLQTGHLREDAETKCLDRDAMLSNAPDQVAGMIRIPPVMKSP